MSSTRVMYGTNPYMYIMCGYVWIRFHSHLLCMGICFQTWIFQLPGQYSSHCSMLSHIHMHTHTHTHTHIHTRLFFTAWLLVTHPSERKGTDNSMGRMSCHQCTLGMAMLVHGATTPATCATAATDIVTRHIVNFSIIIKVRTCKHLE